MITESIRGPEYSFGKVFPVPIHESRVASVQNGVKLLVGIDLPADVRVKIERGNAARLLRLSL